MPTKEKQDLLNIALLEVTRKGYLKKVKKLLEMGADVNAKDENGETPLMKAPCLYRSAIGRTVIAGVVAETAFSIARDLLKAKLLGTPINILAKERVEIKERIRRRRKARTQTAFATRVNIMKTLIEAGADLNATDRRKETALMKAARLGNVDTVETLIKAGANLNVQDKLGSTALMKAADFGLYGSDVIKALAKAGADVNLCDKRGDTALMQAARIDDVNAINALVDVNADVKIQNSFGQTAMMIAQKEGNDAAIKALEKADDVTEERINNISVKDNDIARTLGKAQMVFGDYMLDRKTFIAKNESVIININALKGRDGR